MRYLKTIGRVLAAVAEPLRRNCTFAVFMYLLGCITAWATLPNVRGAHLYDNLYLELFLDVYVFHFADGGARHQFVYGSLVMCA